MIKRKLARKQKMDERTEAQLRVQKTQDGRTKALAKKQAKEEKDKKFLAMTKASY